MRGHGWSSQPGLASSRKRGTERDDCATDRPGYAVPFAVDLSAPRNVIESRCSLTCSLGENVVVLLHLPKCGRISTQLYYTGHAQTGVDGVNNVGSVFLGVSCAP
jgi:hypothetical protein